MEIGIATTPLSDIARAGGGSPAGGLARDLRRGDGRPRHVLRALGSLAAGLGLTLAGPWPGSAPALVGFTPGLGAAMIVVQVLSLALGGYLTGRLRIKWLYVHGHEVFFRDTAHGLLAWAVATVAGVALAALLGSPSDHAVLADATAADPQRGRAVLVLPGLRPAVGRLRRRGRGRHRRLRRDEMHAKYRKSEPGGCVAAALPRCDARLGGLHPGLPRQGPALSIAAALDDLEAEFDLLGDWEERYRHVIDLGRALAPLTSAERTRRQQGARLREPGLAGHRTAGRRHAALPRRFRRPHRARPDRDPAAALFAAARPAEILAFDAKAAFERLGLTGALSAQRSNGLFSMVERIRRDAADLAPTAA